MKKYLLSIISFFISIVCILSYNVIGSSVAPDGTLIEPFYLIPMSWLFLIIGLASLIIVFIVSHLKNKNSAVK